MRYVVISLVALLALGGGGFAWWYFAAGGNKPGITYKAETVARGEITALVTASGTLEPEKVIDVGTQVGGLVKEFGTGSDGKPVYYDSPVEEGTVLARIDDSLYKAKKAQSEAAVQAAKSQVEQAKAKLESARAGVEQAKANTQRAEADVVQTTARADQAGKDLRRLRSIGSAATQQEIDAAVGTNDANTAALGVAKATLAQSRAAELNAAATVADAEAAIGSASAAVATAEAILKQDELNLGYCTITSPFRGTVLDCRVTIGQTVQASFNTPSLFLLAQDLSRMTVWASVNEADIGRVQKGQKVKFNVDAHPGRTFRGVVTLIRPNATNTSNVVMYTVEVSANNPDLALRTYMTANLTFEVDKRPDALLVPNAALRYKPAGAGKTPPEKGFNAVVWVNDNGQPRPVSIKTGISDGTRTEILAGELPEGTELIVGDTGGTAAKGGDGTVNPFANRPSGGGGGRR